MIKIFLNKIAKTSMQTKLVRKDSDLLSRYYCKISSCCCRKNGESYDVDIDDIKVEKKAGGSIKDSMIIQGIVLDKEIVHGGMPKKLLMLKLH